MRQKPLLIASLILPLTGCTTAGRLALAFAPTGAIAVNEHVAEHCIARQQEGRPVDQRHQVRANFAGIAYDTEIRQRTNTAQQQGVDEARAERRRLCPPLPDYSLAANVLLETPEEREHRLICTGPVETIADDDPGLFYYRADPDLSSRKVALAIDRAGCGPEERARLNR